MQWNDPVGRVHLGGGLEVVDCEGDAPLLCVRRSGRHLGLLELLSYRVESAADLQRDLARGEEAALRGHAERLVTTTRDDRSRGCPAGYRVDPIEPRPVRARDGVPMLRYGFVGTTAAGAVVERTVQYATIRDGQLVLLAASAYDDGGCLGREGAEFTTADLVPFESALDALVARSDAPGPVRSA